MSHIIWYPGHELLINNIAQAENCYLYDSEGKRYIDLESGVWCVSIGHSNARILDTIKKQSTKIAHTGFCYSSDIVEKASQEILSLMGFKDGRCVFLCSGSEAVEYGVRTAQSIVDRPFLMTMSDSYFGAYGSASRKQKDKWFSFNWSNCAECRHPIECNEECETWDAIPFSEIGGFLFEPGSSSGLVRFPPVKLIQNLVAAIKRNDGLLMVNEVTTGFGRTGKWFGYQHYDIHPDIVAMGKAIGNGYPVSVTAFAHEVIERLGGKKLMYAQSHMNDALGAAIAMEVIRIIKQDSLIERGREIAATLLAGLEALRQRTNRITELRERGLMVAIELEDNPQASFTTNVHRDLVNQGYLLAQRPGLNVLRIDPSMTININDIEGFLETLESVLKTSPG